MINENRRLSNSNSLSLDLEIQVDDLCNRFEEELHHGVRPNIRHFLDEVDERGRERLLVELLAVLFEVDRQSNRVSDLAAIQQEFPGKSALILRALVKSQTPAAENSQLAETIDKRPIDPRGDLT